MKLCTFDDGLSVGETCSREFVTAPGYSGADFCCRVAVNEYPAAVRIVMLFSMMLNLSLCGSTTWLKLLENNLEIDGSLIWEKANIFRGLKGLLRG